MMHVPEKSRMLSGPMASDSSFGNNGAFQLIGPLGRELFIIASDGMIEEVADVADGWEHVSLQAVAGGGKYSYTPMWEEMAWVKDVFWDAEDTVIQFHPPKSEYVNNHPHVLHMWRPRNYIIPLPPSILVGDKEAGELVSELITGGHHGTIQDRDNSSGRPRLPARAR